MASNTSTPTPGGSDKPDKGGVISLDNLKSQLTDHICGQVAQRENTMVSNIGKLIDSKLDSLKDDIKQKSLNAKYQETRTFKRKGNERQFKLNAQVQDHMETARDQIGSSQLEKAKDTLMQGISLIKDRLKLILMSHKK